MPDTQSPTMEFVISELRKDPDISFADVRDRAAARGLTIYPIVYGRAKGLLGLVPTARRGEGKRARASAARRAAEVEPPPRERANVIPRPPERPQPPRAAASDDRFGDMISEFRRLAEDRERYRDALEQIQQVLNDALAE